MLTKILARSTRLARPTNVLRRGGHGTPSYNEPGGYLFNEKVKKKKIDSNDTHRISAFLEMPSTTHLE